MGDCCDSGETESKQRAHLAIEVTVVSCINSPISGNKVRVSKVQQKTNAFLSHRRSHNGAKQQYESLRDSILGKDEDTKKNDT